MLSIRALELRFELALGALFRVDREVSEPLCMENLRLLELLGKYPSRFVEAPDGVGVGSTETTDRTGNTLSVAAGLSTSSGGRAGGEGGLVLKFTPAFGKGPPL